MPWNDWCSHRFWSNDGHACSGNALLQHAASASWRWWWSTNANEWSYAIWRRSVLKYSLQDEIVKKCFSEPRWPHQFVYIDCNLWLAAEENSIDCRSVIITGFDELLITTARFFRLFPIIGCFRLNSSSCSTALFIWIVSMLERALLVDLQILLF